MRGNLSLYHRHHPHFWVGKEGFMKSYKLVKAIPLMFLGMLCFIVPLFGQITIDWNEIPRILGTRWSKNILYTATVSLGSAGGPQSWSFTTQPMGPDSCINQVVVVNQTPFHDSFPLANLCYSSLDGYDTAYLYMQHEMSFLSMLGFAGADSSSVVFQKYTLVDTAFFPDTFGESRQYRAAWTYVIDANTYMIYRKQGRESINSYGTVTVPYGTFPCLRYLVYDTLTTTMYYNGNPLFSDTTAKINHQFVAENRSAIVCVVSQNNETNPYFMNAASLERQTSYYQGIEETRMAAPTQTIVISPNPFTNRTDLRCTIHDTRYTMQDKRNTTLMIYDVSGRLIKDLSYNLESCIMDHVSWTGTDQSGKEVPDGVYFVRAQGGMYSKTVKIVKTR